MTKSSDSNSIAGQQALRLRRVSLGWISYLFTLSMVGVFWWLGFYGLPVLLTYLAAIVLLNAGFYLAIRSNVNLRFADPSMTLVQICMSIVPGLYVMYHAQQSRGVFLLLCVSAAMYGLFQFRTRGFVLMTAFVVGSYALLIAVVYYFKPQEITLQVELLQLAALFATFLQFGGLGSYIGSLRDKVKEKNKELNARNDDLEHALRRIEELAMRDELTGVFNRRYLMETIKNEKHRCERSGSVFSICILDVDLFKHVNDTYGHLVGDEVLQAIARTATGALRQTDYFGRYGGEEFALVLTGTMVDGAMITAERVRTRIEALRFPSISADLKVTVSIGIADSRFNEETALTFKRADDALYKAKQTGRNRCIIAAPVPPTEKVGPPPIFADKN
ncbi:MAG: GGDEF domain-containing protein [Pseudomonadota bacterium]